MPLNKLGNMMESRGLWEIGSRVPEAWRDVAYVGAKTALGLLFPDGSRRWNLQRDYNWELLLPAIPSLPDAEMAVSGYCQAVEFSDYGMSEVSKIRYGPYRRGYAGFYDIGNLIMTFLKPAEDIVSEYFMAWKDLIVDGNGFYSPKNVYAKPVRVRLYGRDGADMDRFVFEGVFPVSPLAQHALSYKSEEVVEFKIECNVDWLARNEE